MTHAPAVSAVPDYIHWLAWVLCGWLVLAVLTAPAFYLGLSLARSPAHPETALGLALVASAGWAVMAFELLAFSAALRQRRFGVTARAGSQVLLGVGLTLVQLLLMRWWNWPVLGLAGVLRAPDLTAALAAGWPPSVALYAALWCVCQAARLGRANARLELRLVHAELRRLRTQLNPHFLFNTLNAISELGYTDPEAADRTITQLSGLLRKSLDDVHQQEIALRDELDFLRRYLDIQQTLLRGRLHIEFDIADQTLAARVPGMILQPLVENAVTHGIGRNGSGHITLRSRREGEALIIEVEDNGWGLLPATRRSEREGIGVANTRERLRYLYGDLAKLELRSHLGKGCTARLNIPFHEAFAFDENPHLDR